MSTKENVVATLEKLKTELKQTQPDTKFTEYIEETFTVFKNSTDEAFKDELHKFTNMAPVLKRSTPKLSSKASELFDKLQALIQK
ncbi:hypothetical protein [Ligilactobacillus apodemi]|uniref:Uncharacterized protein n=1 Tax=Ligilactobacillus apodemi DSM 16634 = JCM 16172 TaxID=1423724 RepID=A0A0R1TTH1_9LACO|nr:hypothetical protein [Ligilactobacillus apodemi]KRL84601.1 hypothetical protein FC32_GL000497 [Ligilactobacillus apodemi DSM 16634 = JCM 16172]